MIRTQPQGAVPPSGQSPDRFGTRAKAKKRGFFRRFWWWFVLVPVVGLLGVTFMILYVYSRTTVPEAPPGPQTTVLLDRAGHRIASLHAEVNRVVIPFGQIPKSFKNAVIAVEDKDYYRHGAISPFAIIRAAWADVTNRRITQGGSTITQQYEKNVYTGRERTFGRKIKEAIIAVKLEKKYSKNEILGKYLNTVYFGSGAYGVQAAALTYFGHSARYLTTAESATLAAVIRAPETYDPIDHPKLAKERRNLVLQLMAQQRYISEADASELQQKPLKVRKRSPQTFQFAYFVSHVTKQLQKQYGVEQTFSGGLHVTTTLDSNYQRAAEAAVKAHLKSPKDPSAALIAIDPRNGAIRALVGGKDFETAKFNLATQAHRQTGSAFKAFTLAAAMTKKISLKSVWNGPPELKIPNPECYDEKGLPWDVHNYADEGHGKMSLADATANSVNTIFAQLVVEVGPSTVAELAKRMGIESPLEPVCSITLGTQSVTPLDMANGFTTLAARGVRHPSFGIVSVKSADGELLDETKTQGERVLRENDADLVSYALQGVANHGTGTAAKLSDRPVAVKTGTAQNYVDAYLCGYVPQLATCVWVGYPKGEIPMENVEGFTTVFGGSLPALIWHDFMSQALVNVPPANFPTPSFAGYNLLKPKQPKQPKNKKSPQPTHAPAPSGSTAPPPPNPGPSGGGGSPSAPPPSSNPPPSSEPPPSTSPSPRRW